MTNKIYQPKTDTHWYPSFVKRKVFLQTVMTQETQNLNFLIDAPTFVNQLYFLKKSFPIIRSPHYFSNRLYGR